jgi:hypothetical protein
MGRDGAPLECEEKISLLNDNMIEIQELCLQMGCSEEFMRIVLRNMVDSLKRNGSRPFSC